MSMTVTQFARTLMQLGLVSEAVLRELFETPNRQPPARVEDLATELINQRRLTRFQAQVVYAGQGPALFMGNYVLLDQIGEGGMARVYKAVHRRLQRIVALKVLPPQKSAAPVTRFEREYQAAARLSHPQIVTVHDADEIRGSHFLVMDYVEGPSLQSLVATQGPLQVRYALEFVRQIATGIAYAHEQGVVHRDIKPANVMLDRGQIVKILDLGIARLDAPWERQADGLTQAGMMVGTVEYMPPEQSRDARIADARSDVYSLGCTLFFLLTGRMVFNAPTVVEQLIAHREAPIPSIRDFRPDVPARVDAMFQKMVRKLPARRQQSMAEVLREVTSILEQTQPAVAQAAVKPRLWLRATQVVVLLLFVGVLWMARPLSARIFQQSTAPQKSSRPPATSKNVARQAAGERHVAGLKF